MSACLSTVAYILLCLIQTVQPSLLNVITDIKRTQLLQSQGASNIVEDSLTGHQLPTLGHILTESQKGERQKRSVQQPASLTEFLRNTYNSPGLKGNILYVAKKVCHVDFRLDRSLFRRKELLKAEIHIYKESLKKTTNIWRKKTVHAVMSIHQVEVDSQGPGSSKMVDSRLVRVDASGWIKFDITSSVLQWLKFRESNKGLDIWVESIKPGEKPANVARRLARKLVCPDTAELDKVPTLAVFFTEKAPSQQSSVQRKLFPAID